jgi:hypothetical protein
VVSELTSQSKGCGFEPCLIQNTRWKWVKPCHDRFLHPIQVHSWKNKKNIGSQMGQTDKKKTFKKHPPVFATFQRAIMI